MLESALKSPAFNKPLKTKVEETSSIRNTAVASSTRMIEHETSSDNKLLAIETETKQSSTTNCGRGLRERGLELDEKQASSTNSGCELEECKRKHAAYADSIKTVTIGLSQQKERSIRKALWKKIKSEQQIMSINSSNRKLLRSLIADELLNTKLHFTKESCSGKNNKHRRDNADIDDCNNEYKNGDNESSSTNIEYVVDYIKTNPKDDSLYCNNSCGSSSNTSRNEFDQRKEGKEENRSSGIISANLKAEGEDDTELDSELNDEKFPPLKTKLCTPENVVSDNDIKTELRTYNGTQTIKIGDKISGKTTDGIPASYGGPKITDNYIEKENELSEKGMDGNLSVTMQQKQCTDESSVNELLNDDTNMKNETLISNCSKANEEYLRYVNTSKLIDNNGNENNVNRQHNSPSRSYDDTTTTHNTTFKYLNTLKQHRENEHYPENENYANANTEETPSINGMEKYSVDDGCRNAIRNDCSEHIMVNLLNAPGEDFFTYKQTAINSDGFSIVNQLSAKNTRNEYSDASNKLINVNWGNDDKYTEGETHTRKNKAEKELTSSVNQIKQQESIFIRDQQQHQSRNDPKVDAPQNSVSPYHSYLEQGPEFTNSSKPVDMEKQRKFYTSATNVARREHEMYHFNKDLYQKQQSHNDKEPMQSASVFSNMENFEEPNYIQQQKRQKYSPFDKQQQQELQHQRSHNQAHAQQFDQEHFHQQQNVNSSYNLHNFFHSQMQTEIQQSLLQHEQHNNQQHQSHLMAYLHQGSQHRQQQQLQEAYHQRHQYHQRMHHGSHLSPSPHPNNNQHQQQMDKLQPTSISTNNKSIQISTIDELMTDEYHEDHNAEFKLALSPTNAMKHENQDDGYETSAGDVLTPNSHTSSTHSLTPQHQMQHTSNLLPPTKCGDQHFKSHQIQFPISNDGMHSQQLEAPHNIIMGTEMNQDMIAESAASSAVVDAYSFINDELNAVDNVRKTNEVEQNASARSYLELPGGGTKLSTEEVLQQQQPSAIITSPQQDFSDNNILHSNNNNNALTALIYNKTDEKMKEECCVSISMPSQKRRGRKKKVIVPENTSEGIANALTGTLYQQLNPTEEEMTRGIIKTKERKKHDRFNGLPEDEVAKRILPDHLCDNLDIVIVGINPGLFAAYKGHHYAGPGNHFWKCLYLSGLTHEQMGADEDYKLIKYGIGFTNMVQRATKGSADLTRKEIKEGSRILLEKLQRFRPKIAVFNGKLIFEVFSGKKDFNFGRQAECVDGTDTYIWVMPSSSARCAQLPRAADKVPFYAALKKFRDYLNGIIPHIEESECVFTDQKFRQGCEENLKRLAPDSGNSSLQDQNGSLLYDTAKNMLESQNTKLIDTDVHARGNSLLEESSCVNTSIQQQHCNSQQHQLHAYMYVEENVNASRMSEHALDPNPCHVTNAKDNKYILANCHTLHPPQKKKRGRPKKIKEEIGQEMIAPATGNKILVSGQMQARGNDFSNILNLSMMAGTGGAELPKKKRGRPKKIKILTNMTQPSFQDRQQLLVEKCNSMSVQEVTTENVSSPKQHMSFSTTQQPNSQQVIFAISSPSMRSPALNCSFTTVTSPPRQLTPSIQLDEQLCNSRHIAKLETSILGSTQQLHVRSSDSYYTEKLLHSSDASSVASSPHTSQLQQQHINSATSANLPSNDSHLEESSVPNSPNICAVDFQSSKTTGSSDNLDRDMNKNQMPLPQRFHEHSSRYSSPTHEPSAGDQHTTNEHFNQWLSPNHAQRPVTPHDYNHNQLQLQETQQVMPYHDQQNLHHLHQQQTQYNSSFASHWQRIQQQQCYEPNAVSYLMCHTIQQHINTPDVHTYQQQLPGDVTSKSLSGLESLVDQIPTISATDTAASNSLSATAAAAVETRLQSMLYNSSRNLRNSNSGICETSEMYAENVSSNTTNNPKNDNTDLLTSDSRGRNTPLTTNSIYDSGSPGNYNIHRLNSSTPESLLVPHVSPHCQPQTQQLLGSHHQQQHYALLGADRVMDLLPPSKPATIMNNSSPKAASKSTPPLSSSISASDAGLGPGYGCSSSRNTPSNIHTSNFSVSHLAASSLTPPSSMANTNHNYPSSPTNYTVYNRSNLTAAVAPASSANSSSNGNVNPTSPITNTHHMPTLPQMYMDPHAHLSVPVNTMYSHPHTHAHHHGYTCGRPPQHSPIVDYDTTPYGSPSAAVTAVQSSSQNSPVHTLHMPSPNYPYGYATPPTQSSYTSPMHAQSTPPPSGAASSAAAAAVMAGYHHVQHHHHHHGHHTTHHLSMFERPKPSDIGSYCGF